MSKWDHSDWTGRVFGRWTVIGPSAKKFTDRSTITRWWVCKCECGQERTIDKKRLLRKCPDSCGCIRERKNSIAHGHSRGGKRSRLLRTWDGMMNRCYRIGTPNYHRYGGRGIKVCERWKSFVNFVADMGDRPPGMSLDRIDNDGDYCPENCRWATTKQQSRNRGNNVLITVGSETKCITEWAELRGLTCQQVWRRLRLGWSPNEALDFVLGTRRRRCSNRPTGQGSVPFSSQ